MVHGSGGVRIDVGLIGYRQQMGEKRDATKKMVHPTEVATERSLVGVPDGETRRVTGPHHLISPNWIQR